MMGVVINNNKIIGFFNDRTKHIAGMAQNDMRIEYGYEEDTATHIYTIKIFPDTDNCLAGRCYIHDEMLAYPEFFIVDLFIDEQIQKGLMYYEKKMRNKNSLSCP